VGHEPDEVALLAASPIRETQTLRLQFLTTCTEGQLSNGSQKD